MGWLTKWVKKQNRVTVVAEAQILILKTISTAVEVQQHRRFAGRHTPQDLRRAGSLLTRVAVKAGEVKRVNVTGIHHVSINVTDLARSVHFYTTTLGLTLDSSRPDLAVEGVWLNLPNGQVHLIVRDVPAAKGQHFAIGVTELDAAVAELRAAGVAVRGPVPVGAARQAFVSDPDGNAIELQAK